MRSRVEFLGHSLHQLLIVFPLGLLATSAVFDVVALFADAPRMAEVAFWMIVAGVVGGLVAAVPGWLDWMKIPAGTRAKAVGLWHGLGNVVVLGLYAGSAGLRYNDPGRPPVAALVLAGSGLVLALGTGWLGGELVDRLGMGVHEGAHLDAPNSLSGRPATEHTGPSGASFSRGS